MIMTGESRSTWRKICPVPLCPTKWHMDWPGRETEQVKGEMSATSSLRHGMTRITIFRVISLPVGFVYETKNSLTTECGVRLCVSVQLLHDLAVYTVRGLHGGEGLYCPVRGTCFG
jgi:hypothetical protein